MEGIRQESQVLSWKSVTRMSLTLETILSSRQQLTFCSLGIWLALTQPTRGAAVT